MNLTPIIKMIKVYKNPYTNHWEAAEPLKNLLMGSNQAINPVLGIPFAPNPSHAGKK